MGPKWKSFLMEGLGGVKMDLNIITFNDSPLMVVERPGSGAVQLGFKSQLCTS